MSTAVLLLAFLATPASCDAPSPSYGDRPTACEVREFSLPATGALVIDNDRSGGAVDVSAWDRDEVSVRATLRAYGGDGRSPTVLLAATAIGSEGALRSVTEGGGWVEVAYEIRVPRGTDLSVRTRFGAVAVEGVVGEHRLFTRVGAIRLADVGGDVQAETSAGNVTVVASGGTWEGPGLDASTRMGDVRLDVPSGFDGVVEASTRWGSIGDGTAEGRRAAETSKQYLGAGGPTFRLRTRMGDVRIARD